MLPDSLAFTSASELAELIRTRKLSPVELVDYFLERIRALNPLLNAYLSVAELEAKSAAQRAEDKVMRDEALPLLHGVPVSIKDLHFTKGIRTTGGSLVYKDFVPEEDHIAVERLRRAGAIILGKTNTSEFGLSATTENRLGDHCRNPWHRERTSGGSSGGAAASVAAGLGPVALGSDGGGSIRIPSGFCGVYGFKPTHGLVPNYGGFGGMPLFADTGPIVRTVRDAALTLQIIAGPDPRDPVCLRESPPDFLAAIDSGIQGLRVAWSPDLGYAKVSPEVRSIAQTAAAKFEHLGCVVEEATPDIDEPFPIFAPIVLADEYAVAGRLLEEHAAELMPYVKSTLEHGREVPGYRYSQALRALERFRRRMADFFERYDLLLTPTNAVPAFPVGQRPQVIDGQKVDTLWGPFPFTVAFNLTGQPAASLPCGFSAEGLPIGLQIVGRWGDDVTVLRASAAFEQIQPWADKVPSLG
jgi:aspartyl-tRNA(Asn)/glutamyl-tRNA(Gln) amidotransferase subunit A